MVSGIQKVNICAEPKIREPLYFIFILPKHIKDMELKSISGVTFTCSTPCTTTYGHSEGDIVYYLTFWLL